MPKLVKSPAKPEGVIFSDQLGRGQLAEIVESDYPSQIGEIVMNVTTSRGLVLICLNDGGHYSDHKTVRVLSPEETVTLNN